MPKQYCFTLYGINLQLEHLKVLTTICKTIVTYANACYVYMQRHFSEGSMLPSVHRKITRTWRHHFTTWQKNSTIFTMRKLSRWRHWHSSVIFVLVQVNCCQSYLERWCLKYFNLFGAQLYHVELKLIFSLLPSFVSGCKYSHVINLKAFIISLVFWWLKIDS